MNMAGKTVEASDTHLEQIRSWYNEYTEAEAASLSADAPLIQAVEDDEIDPKLLEERIEALRSDISVVRNQCPKCRTLFDNWPDLSGSTTNHPDGTLCVPGTGADWKHAVIGSRNTLALDASARNGCRLCTLLLQSISNAGLLDNFRRMETRIELLGDTLQASLSLQNWSTNQSQLIWLNWPGKVCTSTNDAIGSEQHIVVDALPAIGNSFCPPCYAELSVPTDDVHSRYLRRGLRSF